MIRTAQGPDRGDAPVVVVLGASSGIGRATAHAFAADGARLVLAARSATSLIEVSAECHERGAVDVMTAVVDVTDAEGVAEMIDSARDRFGGIDVWVSAASVYGFAPFEASSPEVIRRILDVNLMGTMVAARLALPSLRDRHGVLILVASAFAELAAPYVVPYTASKHGIAGFAKGLRMELRGRVSVCTVMPASIDTPIYQHAVNLTGREGHPLPPVVAPERVARAIVGLATHPRRGRGDVGRARRRRSLRGTRSTRPSRRRDAAFPGGRRRLTRRRAISRSS